MIDAESKSSSIEEKIEDSIDEELRKISIDGESEENLHDHSNWYTSDEIRFLNSIPQLYRSRKDIDSEHPIDKDILLGLYLNYRKSIGNRKTWGLMDPIRVRKRVQRLIDNLRKRKEQYL